MIDTVHDTQETYRQLLDSMARPGKISELKEIEGHFLPCQQGTFLTAMTLFDAEVSFHVVSDNGLAQPLAEITFAIHTTAENADYIIVPEYATEEEILSVMESCRIGTLSDPQQSSTWIIEQKRIGNEAELFLTGPGIKEQVHFQTELSESFWDARNVKVKEFPLGIDLIFSDTNRRLASIPRTTKVYRTGRDL